MAMTARRPAFDLSRIITWTRIIATVVATTAIVLAASFVAVAISLD
jgi:hypothetical protein